MDGLQRLAFAAFVALAAVGCSSNPDAKHPTLDKAVAGVVLGARVVHDVDLACAAAGKALRESGSVQAAADLTGACAMALKDAADGLEVAATALDAGRAGADTLAACSIARGAKALVMLRPILARHGVKLGATVDAYAKFAAPWLDVAVTMGCPK